MAYVPLPAYQPGNALLDFAPLNAGLKSLGDMWQANKRADKFKAALEQAKGVSGIDPNLLGLADTLGPEHGPNALFGAYNNAQHRAIVERQLAEQRRQHDASIDLQRQALEKNAQMIPWQIEELKAKAGNARSEAEMNQIARDYLAKRGLGAGAGAPAAGAAPAVPRFKYIPGE